MKRLEYKIEINADAMRVYHTILGKDTYAQWAEVFGSTSTAQGTWEEGSEMRFIGTDEEGNEGGMISKVEKNIPGKVIELSHQGYIQNGVVHSGAESDWYGAQEIYGMTEKNGITHLTVEIDTEDSHAAYFEEKYPEALRRIKSLAEINRGG